MDSSEGGGKLFEVLSVGKLNKKDMVEREREGGERDSIIFFGGQI